MKEELLFLIESAISDNVSTFTYSFLSSMYGNIDNGYIFHDEMNNENSNLVENALYSIDNYLEVLNPELNDFSVIEKLSKDIKDKFKTED